MSSNTVKYKIAKWQKIKKKKNKKEKGTSKLYLNAKETAVFHYICSRHYVFTCYCATVIKEAEGLHPAAESAPSLGPKTTIGLRFLTGLHGSNT